MPLLVNIRHLEHHGLELKGELTAAELDIDSRDEMIRVIQPMNYDLRVEKLPGSILVQGILRILLDCRCVRCLEAFGYPVVLEGPICHLELQGEDKVAVVNDCVDLTPYLREDILLEFPRHPVCKPECRGLPPKPAAKAMNAGTAGQAGEVPSAWTELNKLKF
jgi:uncharacterized protein